jgi:hypothetical protein
VSISRSQTTPSGSEQLLSLKWALEAVGGLPPEEAIDEVCRLLGVTPDRWASVVADEHWFIGDPRYRSREEIEEAWNRRWAVSTKVRLDEDSWHSRLWELWLISPRMVYGANLEFLIRRQGRGCVARLAKATGRPSHTVSKWGRWREESRRVRLPPNTIRPTILDFFGLPQAIDLELDALFLGRGELRETVLRAEGRYYLDVLRGLFLTQAVERLREESNRQAEASLRQTS